MPISPLLIHKGARARGRFLYVWVAVALWVLGACDPAPQTANHEHAPLPPAIEGPPSVERVIGQPGVVAAGTRESGFTVVPSALLDDGYASSAIVRARRVVYRVTFRPSGLIGEAHPSIPIARAELVVDVTEERVRARFVGTGWPLLSGAEVRIRHDLPGSYIFDQRGGRPLSSGKLRSWFIGDPSGSGSTPVRVQPASPEEQVGAGLLICRLLAEWSGQRPATLRRRCGLGGAPESFSVGMWVGRRTADVSIPLARAALRADHMRHPRLDSRRQRTQLFMSEAVVQRIEPHRPLAVSGIESTPSLVLNNGASTRLIFTIEGVPFAWVLPGASLEVQGIRPGVYRFAALMPMGALALRYRLAAVPGQLSVP